VYYANVTIHVFAAMLWLGGMFFLAVVGAPVLRTVEPPAVRAHLFRALGRAFRRLAWPAIGVMLVTGVANLAFRGLLDRATLENGAFWSSAYGHALAVKLVCVALMVVLSAVHDFVLGPRASRVETARGAAWIARVNVLLGVLLVVAAVRLARGG
jgi:uncharacterized membrane protein